jgi:hypothetical protein
MIGGQPFGICRREGQAALILVHQPLPCLDLRIVCVAPRFRDRIEARAGFHHHHQPVADLKDIELIDAGLADRVRDGCWRSARTVPMAIGSDRGRMVIEIEQQ